MQEQVVIDSRYALDRDLFPNRIILGTETFPTRIDRTWQLVEQYSHVIGDFTGPAGTTWAR
ncbi:hypothetical protein [Streptomyces sp. NPDC059862]|uniref:hypothetical protein n=1 Tax=unclassified Streptomyces TaxID=2593676 RepID=UPI0036271172